MRGRTSVTFTASIAMEIAWHSDAQMNRSTLCASSCLYHQVESALLPAGNRRKRLILPIIIGLMSLPFVCSGQEEFNIVKSSIYYPRTYAPKELKMELAVSIVKVPFDWVETEQEALRELPLLQFQVNYGLPKNFTLNGKVSALGIANQLGGGIRYNLQINNFSFAPGFDMVFSFGYRHDDKQFDSSFNSWTRVPNLSFGYRLKDLCFTLRAEFPTIDILKSRQGDYTSMSTTNETNGYTVGLYLEQRLTKKKVLVIGIKNSYAQFHMMGWIAFSGAHRYYNIPELEIGLVL